MNKVMRNIFYVVLVIMLFLIEANSANAVSRSFLKEKCKKIFLEQNVATVVTYNYGKLSYDSSKSDTEIKKMFLEQNPKLVGIGSVNGLTVQKNYMDVAAVTGVYKMENGYFCYFPTSVNITVGYRDSQVYLANSLKKGTCDYRRVLRHEQTHLDLAHTAIDLLALTLRSRIEAVVQNVGPIFSKEDINSAAVKLSTKYKDVLEPIYDIYVKDLSEQHSKIDTIDNYIKEELICKNSK